MVDTIRILKECAPFDYDLVKSEWVSMREFDGEFIFFDMGFSYYYTSEVLDLISKSIK